MDFIIIIVAWLVTGFYGYTLILRAYERLEGEITKSRIFGQSISIILGPVAIVIGVMFLVDILLNPPKK